MKRDLDDLCTELNGISALVSCLFAPYLDGEVTVSNTTMGDALFSIRSYIDRITKDLLRVSEERIAQP